MSYRCNKYQHQLYRIYVGGFLTTANRGYKQCRYRDHIIYSAVCLTTDPEPLPQPVGHRVRSDASYFNSQYSLFFLRSSGSCLRLLSGLSVTSIPPSRMCFERQFLRKMLPVQLTFLVCTVFRIFLSSCTLYNTSSFLTR